MLPNLLIIGAAKCGTTSLHGYLALHPEIHMSSKKELNFWNHANCMDRLSSYKGHFPVDLPVRGEASVRYSFHPIFSGTADRIHAAVPEMRLIYLVRDPVYRAIAHYLQSCSRGREVRPIEEAFRDLADPLNPYLAASRYSTQIDQYMRLFPRSSLLVVDQHDLLVKRDETLREVFGFLDVDESFASPKFEETHNPTAAKRRRLKLYESLRGSGVTRLARALVPETAWGKIVGGSRRVLSRRVETPKFSGGLEEELAPLFEDEVRRLRAFTGKGFSSWESTDARS